jgi:hypothetical protein
MTISQRNGTSSVTPTNAQYTLDRWNSGLTQASKFSVQQDAGAVTPPAGFSDYLGVTSLSAYSITSTDIFSIYQPIEGFNTADLGFGTANAKTVTLSFWVRSSLTGTFGGAIYNAAANRSYPFTYTISSANTWEYETITIAGDTTGTWVGATNGIGMYVTFSLGTGSTYSGTAGAWAGTTFTSATGTTSVVGTNGATWYITGVQLEVGTQATSFEYRQYQQELALCQRYYWKIARGTSESYGITGNTSAGNAIWSQFGLPVTMRATPTVTIYGTWAASNTGQPTIRGASASNFLVQIVPTATGIATAYPDSSDDLIDASIEL